MVTDDTGAAPHVVAHAIGTYPGQPINGDFVGGAMLSLRDATMPYPVDLQVANGPTHAKLVGTVQDPLNFAGTDLKLELAGTDMEQLLPLIGIAFPKTPSYQIKGDLDYTNGKFHFRDFIGQLGSSDVQGTIEVDPGQKRPVVTADVTSRQVDLADLGGFLGLRARADDHAEPNARAASRPWRGPRPVRGCYRPKRSACRSCWRPTCT